MSRRIPTRGLQRVEVQPHGNSAGRFDSLRERMARPGEGSPSGVMPDFYKNLEALLGDRLSVDLGGGVVVRRDALGGISVSSGNLLERMNAKPSAVEESAPDSPEAAQQPTIAHPFSPVEPEVKPEATLKAPAQFVVPDFPTFKEKP